MAKLIYSAITSLDGYIEDEHGVFEWAAPDAEVLTAVNELERPIGTYIYGRRMYETMLYWETAEPEDLDPESRAWMEIWRAADKIVYSRTLTKATTSKTQIAREFDPAAIRRLKDSSAHDITIGGADIAGQAMAAGLVDEIQLFLNPVIIGGGKRALPDGVRTRLELTQERRFRGGVVFLGYQVRG